MARFFLRIQPSLYSLFALAHLVNLGSIIVYEVLGVLHAETVKNAFLAGSFALGLDTLKDFISLSLLLEYLRNVKLLAIA